MVYRCNFSVGFPSASLRLLLNHLRRNHSNEPNFHILCGLNGCHRTDRRFVSFRIHLIRKHNFELRSEEHRQWNGLNNECSIEPTNKDVATAEELFLNSNDVIEPEKDLHQFHKDNALCLIVFADKGCVSQRVVNQFVESSTKLYKTC